MRLRVFVCAFVVCWVAGCWKDFGCGGGQGAPRSDVVIAVGERSYTEADLQVRVALENYLHPQSGAARLGAAQQLVHGALLLQALFRLGAEIKAEDLEAEVARIFRDSKSPERLAIMERIGGGRETRSFKELIVLPDFANQRYYFAVYPMHPGAHFALRQRARALLAELQAEGPAADLRKRADGQATLHDQVAFSARRGFYALSDFTDPSMKSALGDAGETSRRLEDEVFAKQPVGSLHGDVVELPDALVLLRWTAWLDEAAGVRAVERLVLPKRPAEDFLWELVGDLPVRIADEALEQAFQQQIPWSRRIKWSP